MSTPTYPMQKVYVRPPLTADPGEPVVTLERDARGVWWHVVGAVPVREATVLEQLLPLSPSAWAGFTP